MATLTNIAANTATVTNRELSSADMSWDEADFPWSDAAGTWENPYRIANIAANTATLVNLADS